MDNEKELLEAINRNLVKGDNKKIAVKLKLPLGWGQSYVSDVRAGRKKSKRVLDALKEQAMLNKTQDIKVVEYLNKPLSI